MYRKAATLVCGVILIFALTSTYLCAQDYGTVSGTVTDPAGQPVPNAKVAIKNATTGQLSEAQTDSAGHYLSYRDRCRLRGLQHSVGRL